MNGTEAIGHVRRSMNGDVLRVNISRSAFIHARTYMGRDAEEYVDLIVNMKMVKMLIDDGRAGASLCQPVELDREPGRQPGRPAGTAALR